MDGQHVGRRSDGGQTGGAVIRLEPVRPVAGRRPRRHGRAAARWGKELLRYAGQAQGPRSLVDLLQVRLSLSLVGRWACPSPVDRLVALRSLGGAVLLRSHTSDISVLNELIVSDGYAVPASLVPVPETVLDLGANTGLAARWFLHCWPGARLVAVEPEAANVVALRHNLAHRDAVVLAVAVGGHARTAALHTDTGAFGFSLVEAREGLVAVPVVTMETVLERGGIDRIDLLKADIEGAERELFADCSGWIHRVQALIVECHAGYSAAELLEDCRRGGADFELVDLDSKPEWGFEVVTAVRVAAGLGR